MAFPQAADLRELYHAAANLSEKERVSGVRNFLERIHAAFNAIDAAPFYDNCRRFMVFVSGGGFELALACDIIVADKMARFAFPELRLGLIPGFGGIPRLKRDLGNAFIRDLLLTGRSVNATRCAIRGAGLRNLRRKVRRFVIARATAAQVVKFDAVTRAAAKKIHQADTARKICAAKSTSFANFLRAPAVMAALKKFVESTDAMPYLP